MEMDPTQPSTTPTRRFIYLIMDGGNDTHTLHRIDTSPLFARGGRAQHGTPEAAQPAAGAATQPLPHPLVRFDCARGRRFFALGCGVDKIVGVDSNRHTVIFDTRTESVRAGPTACYDKWHARWSPWAEVGGRLYHLGGGPGYEEQDYLDFEALTYDPLRDDWFWNILPSPPLDRFWNTIESLADAGAASSTMRITALNRTYAFDAARASWRKEGDWELPFHGRAQYVADYGLWFGFLLNSQDSDLCAADLDVAGSPDLQHIWANVDGHASQDGKWLESSYLSYMGGGRFCVTRFFTETDKDGRSVMEAVVTAVEAKRDGASATGKIRRMVKRASVRYHSPECEFPCWAWAY